MYTDLTAPVDVTHADCAAAAAGIRHSYAAARHRLHIDTWEPAPFVTVPPNGDRVGSSPAPDATSQRSPIAETPLPGDRLTHGATTGPGGALIAGGGQ